MYDYLSLCAMDKSCASVRAAKRTNPGQFKAKLIDSEPGQPCAKRTLRPFRSMCSGTACRARGCR